MHVNRCVRVCEQVHMYVNSTGQPYSRHVKECTVVFKHVCREVAYGVCVYSSGLWRNGLWRMCIQ